MIGRSLPPQGFVIAVRATIVGRLGGSHKEWLITSRWGDGGSYLSIARTLVGASAAATAPEHLAPRWSALAVLDSRSASSSAPYFNFMTEPPTGVRLAGRFAPSLGGVSVAGEAQSMRLRGDIHCLGDDSRHGFQFNGARMEWVGEFIEAPA